MRWDVVQAVAATIRNALPGIEVFESAAPWREGIGASRVYVVVSPAGVTYRLGGSLVESQHEVHAHFFVEAWQDPKGWPDQLGDAVDTAAKALLKGGTTAYTFADIDAVVLEPHRYVKEPTGRYAATVRLAVRAVRHDTLT